MHSPELLLWIMKCKFYQVTLTINCTYLSHTCHLVAQHMVQSWHSISDFPLHAILYYGWVPIVEPIDPRKHFLLVTLIIEHTNCKCHLLFVGWVRFAMFGKNELLSWPKLMKMKLPNLIGSWYLTQRKVSSLSLK